VNCQPMWVREPGPSDQVFGRLIAKAGLRPVECVWETLNQEEDRLGQDWPIGRYTRWTVSKQESC
jgi:hypothetical protein